MWGLALGAAALGGLVGGISAWQRGNREKAALKQQKASAWQQYLYGSKYSDESFDIQKKEARNNLNMQKQNLDSQVDLSIGDYNTSLLAQAFGIQDARIQAESSLGAQLAYEGASGTRGNEANEMIRAYAAAGLERNIGVQDRQNTDYLKRLTTGADMTSHSIAQEKASWMPGGHRYQMKQAQDNYNRNIAELGQTNFDWQISQAKPGFLDYFTGVMGGASSGLGLGIGIAGFRDMYQNPWNNIGKKSHSTQGVESV